MRRFAALLSCFVLFACFTALAVSGPADRQPTDPKSVQSPANPQARPVPIEDLFFTRSAASPSWSHDSRWIAFSTNLTGRFNIYKVASAGGWPIQMVQSDDRQYGAVFSPDDKWIVYQQDFGGGEIWDLFAVPADGGEAVNLTNTPLISETGEVFSPDGKYLAFNSKPKASPVTDIAVMDWSTRQVRQLTHEATPDHLWQLVAWSPDSKYIYAGRIRASFTDADIYRIDVATGREEDLTPHQGEVMFFASGVSPDGKVLLISSNQKGGFPNVALLGLATRKLTWVTDTQWEAAPGGFSSDREHFTYTINHDGIQDTYLATLRGHGEKLAMPEGLTYPDGTPDAFSPDGKRLLLTHQSPQRPADFWIYDLAAARPTQLTYSGIASLTPASLPPAQVVHYKTFDGKIISAILYMPYNLKRDGSNPAIVLPHGGPTGQVTEYFARTAAALASHGYICIAPNVRGSTGYGIVFQKANFKDLGGGDLQDEVYAVKWLLDTGFVDPKKVGITGGSYGGYMTLMAIGKTPDVWAAAVEEYGIINWLTMLQHEDPFLQQYEKSLLGDPVKDRAVYEDASPIKYLANAQAPLLVLQGENDIRVPKEEAEQVVSILRQHGKTVDVKYYAAEGHGFEKRENQIDAIRRTLAWFDKYLKGAPAADVKQ